MWAYTYRMGRASIPVTESEERAYCIQTYLENMIA